MSDDPIEGMRIEGAVRVSDEDDGGALSERTAFIAVYASLDGKRIKRELKGPLAAKMVSEIAKVIAAVSPIVEEGDLQ